MPNNTFNAILAETISALKSSSFTPKLMRLIRSIVNFDCAVALGYTEGKHPIYLYDSIESERELLFKHYLTASFQNDPFYQQLKTSKQQGIFTSKDITYDAIEHQNYYQQFYAHTGWKDELSMLIEIEPERWVIFYFGCTDENKRFSKHQIQQLKSHFAVIQSLSQQHWQQTRFTLSEPASSDKPCPSSIRETIERTLDIFGQEQLTKREQQVLTLIIQGFDSKEIALELDISEGTVKNHRKKIYAQLNVSSLSELFRLFLNFLITQQR